MAKIILTHELQGLGVAGDVVEVKNGYARNYLVPQGYAINWSRGAETQIAALKAAREARAIATTEEAEALKAKLEETKIRIPVKAGVGGRLFGAVKTATVAAAIEAAGIGTVDKRKVTLPKIKTTGEYSASVNLHDGVDASVVLQVISEK